MYSALSQCAQVNLTYSENDSEAIAKGISDSFSTAINEGISDTTGTNYGTSTSKSRSHNHGSSFGMFGVGHNSGSGRAKTSTTSSGTSTGHTDTRSETETTGKTTSDTTTTTTGSTSTIAVTKQNKTVQALLGRIDEQLERIKSCESYGLWDSACYFIAENPETSLVAANTFKAIVAGEKHQLRTRLSICGTTNTKTLRIVLWLWITSDMVCIHDLSIYLPLKVVITPSRLLLLQV